MKKKGGFRKLLYSQKAAPYVFILPFLLTFAIFFVYPLINAVIMSFQKVSARGNTWVGLKNYQTLLNPVFYKAVGHSIFYTIITLILMIPIPMLLATMLNSKLMKGKTIFRSIMFIPALTSVVVAGTVFRLMFGELSGSFFNQILGFFGKEPLVWLRNQNTVWIALFAICLWRWTGVNMMYYLSGLQQIPEELYESAAIDGATSIQAFFNITVPLLKDTTVYVLTISIYGGLAMFTESYILFNGNNSPNNVGLTVVGYLYRMGWEQNNVGLACAVGCILIVLVLGINIVQLTMNGTFKKKEA